MASDFAFIRLWWLIWRAAGRWVRRLPGLTAADHKFVRVGFSNSYRGTTDDAAILRVTGEKGAAFFNSSLRAPDPFGIKRSGLENR